MEPRAIAGLMLPFILAVILPLVVLAPVSAGVLIAWTGASGVNSDFATATNWSPAQVPSDDDSVLVHSGDSIRLTANVLFESLILESTGRDSPSAMFIADSPTAFAVSVGSLNVTSGRVSFQSTLGIRSACALTDGHLSAQAITVTAGNQYCYLSGNVTFNAPQWQVDGTLVLATVSSRTGLDTYVSGASGDVTHSATARVVFLSTGTAPVLGATLATPQSGATISGTIEMSALGQRLLVLSATATVSPTWTNPALSTLQARDGGSHALNFGAGTNNVPQTLIIADFCDITTTGGGAAGLNFGSLELFGTFQLPLSNPATAVYTFQRVGATTGFRTALGAVSVIGAVVGSQCCLLNINVVQLDIQRKLSWDGVALTTSGTARLSFPMYLSLDSVWTLPASGRLTLDRYSGLFQSAMSSTVNWAGSIVVTNETVVDLHGANPTGIGWRSSNGILIDPTGTITFSGSMTLLDGAKLTFQSNTITLTGTSFVNCTTPRAHFQVQTYTQTWAATSAVVGPGWLTIESVITSSTVNFLQYPVVKVPDNVVLIRQSITFASPVTLKTLQLRDGTALSLRGLLTADSLVIRGDSFYVNAIQPSGPAHPALQSDFGCNQNAIPIVIKQLFVQQNLTRGDQLELSRVSLTITDAAEISANVLLNCGSELNIASTANVIFAPYQIIAADRPQVPVMTFARPSVVSPPNLVQNNGSVTFGTTGAAINAFIDLGAGGVWRNGPVSLFAIGGGAGPGLSAVTIVPPVCFIVDSGALIDNEPVYNSSLCNATLPVNPASLSSTGGGAGTGSNFPLTSSSSSTGVQTSAAIKLVYTPTALSLSLITALCLVSILL